MKLGWLFALPLALQPFAGCASSSGQTGSPSCAAPESCVCGPQLVAPETLLRVRVESADTQQLVGTVVEVLGSNDSLGPVALEGQRIGGFIARAQPCEDGARPRTAPAVESEVLVVFRLQRQGPPTADALLDGYMRFAVLWTDPLDFGEGTELAHSELDLLLDYGQCVERFPIEPMPCNDVVYSSSSTSCSVRPFSRRN
jgi:hypothetical protein